MNRAAAPLKITVRGVIGSVLVAAVALTCIRLGFWQLDRLDRRRAANEALAARRDAPPVTVSSTLSDTTGLRFRSATASGEWDGDRTIVLPGRSYRGVPGAHVLSPLRLTGGAGLLVNRGWVPSADAATVDTTILRIEGEALLEGLIDAFPGREATLARRAGEVEATGSFRRVWYAIDERRLREQFPYPLLDLTLQLLPSTDAPDFPVRLAAPPLDEGPHLGYAIQWFSFAAIALIGWTALILKSRGKERPS